MSNSKKNKSETNNKSTEKSSKNSGAKKIDKNNPPHNEPKNLHENSDYPVHHPFVGTVKPTKL